MNIRYVLVALATAGASLVIGAAPAFASGPPVPPGCSFDQGVLTCATTTTTTNTIGPFSTDGVSYLASDTFGGFTGEQICEVNTGIGGAISINMSGVTLAETVTTTTTTERHGLNGNVFNTSTSTSPPSLTGVQGAIGCGF